MSMYASMRMSMYASMRMSMYVSMRVNMFTPIRYNVRTCYNCVRMHVSVRKSFCGGVRVFMYAQYEWMRRLNVFVPVIVRSIVFQCII